MIEITPQKISKMSYVELMAFLEEVNRPPGGKNSIRVAVQNCFITKDSKVLDIGCNTGYCSFEIARLSRCLVTGIDISPAMIMAAKKFQEEDPLGNLIKFRVADAMYLPFAKEMFDVVISGRSTAFIENKERAIKEYARVLKPWGFIADINFYYKTNPSENLVYRLNALMNVSIKPWDINFWLNLYESCGMEKYFIHTGNIKLVSQNQIENYCMEMTKNKNLSKETRNALKKRLTNIMNLFNKNHKCLGYAVFILRKRPTKEQISLFGA